MAKEQLSPEQKKELQQKKKEEIEAAKLRKEKEKRQKEKEKREMDKVRKVVQFPFKALFSISMIVGIITFMIMFFGNSGDFIDSVYYGFLMFSVLYVGGGLLLLVILFIKSEHKKKEIEEKKKIEEEEKKLDNIRREEELARLEQMQKNSIIDEFKRTENRANEFE